MPTIESYDGAYNMGGGCYLILARSEDVFNVPVPQSEEVPPIELRPGKEFTTISPIRDTLKFNEEPVTDKGADAYHVNVTFAIPKNDKARLAFQNETKGQRYIAVFVTMNGNALLIGNSQMPVRLTFSRDTGEDSADRNGVLVTIDKIFPYSMPYYIGLDTTAIGDFNYDFNNDFL